jgi:hypothetical protein
MKKIIKNFGIRGRRKGKKLNLSLLVGNNTSTNSKKIKGDFKLEIPINPNVGCALDFVSNFLESIPRHHELSG